MAEARTSGEPVFILSQNTTAKPTIELVSVEKNCPDHMIMNVLFQLFINVIYSDRKSCVLNKPVCVCDLLYIKQMYVKMDFALIKIKDCEE